MPVFIKSYDIFFTGYIPIHSPAARERNNPLRFEDNLFFFVFIFRDTFFRFEQSAEAATNQYQYCSKSARHSFLHPLLF